jgi:hypothetical protein
MHFKPIRLDFTKIKMNAVIRYVLILTKYFTYNNYFDNLSLTSPNFDIIFITNINTSIMILVFTKFYTALIFMQYH